MIDKEELKTLYLKDKLSLVQIAQKFKCSVCKVQYWMKKYNIPSRNIKEGINIRYKQTFKINKETLYWKSYVFFVRLEKQKEISQKLAKIIPNNIIYNFNYYFGELSKDHLSFRIKADRKFHNKIQNYLHNIPYKIQDYKDGALAESYAMGTFLSQQFKSNLKKLEILDRELNTKLYATILHGFINNLVNDSSCERKIYFRIWKALFKKEIFLKVEKIKKYILKNTSP